MDKLLLFAGTTEGRSLAEFLERSQVPVHVCVATEYGESLMEETGCRTIYTGRLDAEGMSGLMEQTRYAFVIDATHPYARDVSENIRKACQKTKHSYLRLLRDGQGDSKDTGLIRVNSVKEAVEFLKETTGNILVTTGSKELEAFTELPGYRERIYARVLSTVESVSASAGTGFQGKHLICMQGPYAEELNTAMLKHVNARWLVTKESGKAGGFEEKLCAARAAGAGLVVIRRPEEKSDPQESFLIFDEIEIRRFLCEKLRISVRRRISIVGAGMGSSAGMTEEARQVCRDAQLLIGAGRVLAVAGELHKTVHEEYRADKIYTYVMEHPEYERIALLLSGDVGFYSGAKQLHKVFEREELQIYPGISSVVYLCAKAGVSWEDVKLISLHGREQNLISAVLHHKKVFVLTGGTDGISVLCEKLLYYGLDHVQITAGVRLSYPDEQILKGTPGEFLTQSVDPLCSVLIRNENAQSHQVHGICDEDFLRDKVPMTKGEVRSISLSKLRLTRDAVIYDIGAGTGSVSIEMALQAWDGHVYAIEKKPEAAALLKENRRKFCADNLTIVEGVAPEALSGLPVPTHVFIGGSSGNLRDIMDAVLKRNRRVRIVINAIALETASEALECLKSLPLKDTDIVTVQTARAREIGAYHMMMGQNPVFVISCTGRDSHE